MKGLMFSLNLPSKIANGEKKVTRRSISPKKDEPYKVGEILYVREKWRPISWKEGSHWTIEFADGETKHVEHLFDDPEKENDFWIKLSDELTNLEINKDKNGNFIFSKDDIKWRNTLFMPKNAARTFLKITEVRKERLHDISESDAKREGVDIVNPRDFGIHDEHRVIYKNYLNSSKHCRFAKESFKTLWIFLHGIESWNENPYIWVLNFEKTNQHG